MINHYLLIESFHIHTCTIMYIYNEWVKSCTPQMEWNHVSISCPTCATRIDSHNISVNLSWCHIRWTTTPFNICHIDISNLCTRYFSRRPYQYLSDIVPVELLRYVKKSVSMIEDLTKKDISLWHKDPIPSHNHIGLEYICGIFPHSPRIIKRGWWATFDKLNSPIIVPINALCVFRGIILIIHGVSKSGVFLLMGDDIPKNICLVHNNYCQKENVIDKWNYTLSFGHMFNWFMNILIIW